MICAVESVPIDTCTHTLAHRTATPALGPSTIPLTRLFLICTHFFHTTHPHNHAPSIWFQHYDITHSPHLCLHGWSLMSHLNPTHYWLLMTTILLFNYFFTHSLNDVCTGIEMFEELFLSVRSDGGYEWLWQRLLKCMTLHGEDQNTQHTVPLYTWYPRTLHQAATSHANRTTAPVAMGNGWSYSDFIMY